MTLQTQISKLEKAWKADSPAKEISKELVDRLANALTNGREDYRIHDIFDAWEKKRGET